MRAQQSSETLSKELSNPNASLISCYSKATKIAATGQVMAVNHQHSTGHLTLNDGWNFILGQSRLARKEHCQ